MWCNVGFAEVIEMDQCYSVNKISFWSFAEWDKRNNSHRIKYEPKTGKMNFSHKEYYSKLDNKTLTIDTKTGKILITNIYSEDSLEESKKYYKWHTETEEGKKALDPRNRGVTEETLKQLAELLNITVESYIEKRKQRTLDKYAYPKKYEVIEYDLYSYSGGVVIGEIKKDSGYDDVIYVELGKGVYKTGVRYPNKSKEIQFTSNLCNINLQTESTESSSGTAFFINSKGNLLTNNHVVEGCEVSKINYFNKEYDTDLIATDKTLDLALLKAELIPKSYIAFSSNEPKKRDLIIIAGYPLGEYLSDDLKINEGKISSLKGFDNNSNEITVDLAINPGNSGGPIVDENGQLVAVAVAGMSKEVTEGISFGIKSSAVANFLKSNKISPDIKLTSFSMNDEKVNQLLEDSTVYTFCN
jgi:S1-C subfamily serine protease